MQDTSFKFCGTIVATLPAFYRAQNEKNGEIPFSESKNTLFRPPLGTHFNGHFRAFNSPLLYKFLYEGVIKCPKMAFKMGPKRGAEKGIFGL